MMFADWLDNLVENFVHNEPNRFLECSIFFPRSLRLEHPDRIVHLAIEAQESVENETRCLLIFEQANLRQNRSTWYRTMVLAFESRGGIGGTISVG